MGSRVPFPASEIDPLRETRAAARPQNGPHHSDGSAQFRGRTHSPVGARSAPIQPTAIPIIARFALMPPLPVPQPHVANEFSHLLVAETLAVLVHFSSSSFLCFALRSHFGIITFDAGTVPNRSRAIARAS